MAAEEIVLPDAAVCTRDVMLEATSKEHSCAETLYHRDPAVESCCAVLADYYGPNSTRATRHCFCVESYFNHMHALSEISYVAWEGYFDKCTELGYPIYYFQDGAGPCNPAAAEPAVEEAVDEEIEEPAPMLPMRSLGAWGAGLQNDGWSLAAFIMSLLGAIGGTTMAWAFVFDACSDLRRCSTKRARRAAA
ncbi:hypothetical protein D9Q98_005846 [Chlorella vulgaris]|uniref:Uncharacterized protein n=1 Tax=Chlorella vulgaris TaxID=3077 RepID=A0A9D4TWK6_CHLVU|nr:hypothetical protein D9Q98_005846 [Chlorella vulgaris]